MYVFYKNIEPWPQNLKLVFVNKMQIRPEIFINTRYGIEKVVRSTKKSFYAKTRSNTVIFVNKQRKIAGKFVHLL